MSYYSVFQAVQDLLEKGLGVLESRKSYICDLCRMSYSNTSSALYSLAMTDGQGPHDQTRSISVRRTISSAST